MTRIVTDGVSFTKRMVKQHKKNKALYESIPATPETLQAVKIPTPVEIWKAWSPDNKIMYKSQRYRGIKRAWQIWATYIAAGSYIPLNIILERNKKKMLKELENGQK